jgi:hypothetical protein
MQLIISKLTCVEGIAQKGNYGTLFLGDVSYRY